MDDFRVAFMEINGRALERDDRGFIAAAMSTYDDIGRRKAICSLPTIYRYPIDVVSFSKIQLPKDARVTGSLGLANGVAWARAALR